MEMGGKPGEFVGTEVEIEELDKEDSSVQEPDAEALQVEADADGSIDEASDDMETGEAQDVSALGEDVYDADHEEEEMRPADQ